MIRFQGGGWMVTDKITTNIKRGKVYFALLVYGLLTNSQQKKSAINIISDIFKEDSQPQLCHIRPPWNADYKANAAGKKVNFTYYSAFAAE